MILGIRKTGNVLMTNDQIIIERLKKCIYSIMWEELGMMPEDIQERIADTVEGKLENEHEQNITECIEEYING